MSGAGVTRTVEARELLPSTTRSLALGAAGVLSLTYLSILYHVADVVGDVRPFVVVVLAALGLAALLAPTLRERTAVALGVVLLVGGLGVYLATVPQAYLDLNKSIADTAGLLTGLSVLRMTNVGVWVLGFAPGPVFVSWYFFLRRDYAAGTLVGGAALSWFVLTGDAGTVLALAGTVAGLAAIGLGDLDRLGGTRAQLGTIGALVVAVLVVTTSVSVVPGGEGQPLVSDEGTSTVEASLVSADDRVGILGSIRLSPQVRFTVEASAEERWRVGAYDRYTGSGWIRTGESVRYQGPRQQPPGPSRRVVQTYTAEDRIDTMPAAWKPIRVGSGASARVTDLGDLKPTETLSTGDEYTVESAVPVASAGRLRRAGTDYPTAVEQRYVQVPESTPDRVADLTAQVTAEATNPYDTAVAVERYLESEKGYSLDVSQPEGDIADAFLFEMERGYCTYYATTMVTMLRTQGIPARFVVGYLPGQSVADDEWVVRGYDSHAWVEVYFPETGWVAFDPTPAGPRQEAEQARLSQARANDETGVDTDDSLETGPTPSGADFTPAVNTTPTANGTDSALNPAEGEIATTPVNASDGAGGESDGGGIGIGIGTPTREEAAYGLVLLAGVLVAGQRLGVFDRIYRRYWLRRPIAGDPPERVEQVVSRLEYVLGKRYRPRRPDETPREYHATLKHYGADDAVLQLYELYERVHYAGRVDDEEAAEARRLYREAIAGASLSTRLRPWT